VERRSARESTVEQAAAPSGTIVAVLVAVAIWALVVGPGFVLLNV
jgi:hypothetical protein